MSDLPGRTVRIGLTVVTERDCGELMSSLNQWALNNGLRLIDLDVPANSEPSTRPAHEPLDSAPKENLRALGTLPVSVCPGCAWAMNLLPMAIPVLPGNIYTLECINDKCPRHKKKFLARVGRLDVEEVS